MASNAAVLTPKRDKKLPLPREVWEATGAQAAPGNFAVLAKVHLGSRGANSIGTSPRNVRR